MGETPSRRESSRSVTTALLVCLGLAGLCAVLASVQSGNEAVTTTLGIALFALLTVPLLVFVAWLVRRAGGGWPQTRDVVSSNTWSLFMFGMVLAPMAFGDMALGEWRAMPAGGRALGVFLTASVVAVLLMSFLHLLRAPAEHARPSTVAHLLVTGAIFVLFSTGPLLVSDRWTQKPWGAMALVIGVALLLLGVREVVRWRAVRARRRSGDVQPV